MWVSDGISASHTPGKHPVHAFVSFGLDKLSVCGRNFAHRYNFHKGCRFRQSWNETKVRRLFTFIFGFLTPLSLGWVNSSYWNLFMYLKLVILVFVFYMCGQLVFLFLWSDHGNLYPCFTVGVIRLCRRSLHMVADKKAACRHGGFPSCEFSAARARGSVVAVS